MGNRITVKGKLLEYPFNLQPSNLIATSPLLCTGKPLAWFLYSGNSGLKWYIYVTLMSILS